MVSELTDLKIKIFADGANIDSMIEMAAKEFISGLTTNPTLMKKSGVKDFRKFAKDVLAKIQNKPISFEVFSDDLSEMKNQALEISSWAENVYVKIPITNSEGISTAEVISFLSERQVKINVTAVLTVKQVAEIFSCLKQDVPSYISVFAGRIADTGVDPIPLMKEVLGIIQSNLNCELIWASPRELLNLFQANEIGCHAITMTSDLLGKLNLIGKDLNNYSLETVQMFKNDALASNYSL